MKALLKKDLLTLVKQLKLFLAILVVFACFTSFSLSSFALIYAAMLPITALAYDEQSKWDRLAVMMPYSIRDLVLSKYLLGYLFAFAACLLSVGAQFAASRLPQLLSFLPRAQFDAESLAATAVMLCVALVLMACALPALYKLGVEKGRMVFLCIGVLILSASFLLQGRESLLAALPGKGVLWAAPVLVVLLNALSVGLSCRFYKQRLTA